MNIDDIKNRRKESVLTKINNQIEEQIVKLGWNKIIISCPDDLYKEIKLHYEQLGFKLKEEKYEYRDMDGWGAGEYGYNYYLSI